MNTHLAQKILKKAARDYDRIATDFDVTRSVLSGYKMQTAKKIKSRSSVLDAGCGNGILYGDLSGKSIKYTGVDASQKLLNIAKKKYGAGKFVKGSIINLPFKDKLFDWVIAFAVLHHIPSDELRLRAVKELYRVMKPGGRAAVTVWNFHSDFAEKKYHVSAQLARLLNGMERGGIQIPWKYNPKRIVDRYIYVFDKEELVDLFKKAGFKKIRAGYVDRKGKLSNYKHGEDIFLEAIKKD